MGRFAPNPTPCGRTRREFLWQVGGGFAGLALLDMLARDGALSARADEVPGVPVARVPARAKRAIFLFMNGGPSQVDTFDPKPTLDKYHGTPYRGETPVGSNGRPIGMLMKSPFPFRKHGASGLEISSLYPNVARYADDLCVIRSMQTDTAAHASGCLQLNTGSVQIGKPCLGSWVSYGLGHDADDLPNFVVMTDPRGGPIGGASNWSAGYMPASYQATMFRSQGPAILDLATPEGTTDRSQRDTRAMLEELNRLHQAERPGHADLAARVRSYELAFAMQSSADEAVNLDAESPATRSMYGLDDDRTRDFSRKCLMARRLLERGVRFVQLYSGGGHLEDTWDGHSDCITNHTTHAGETDQPIAALIADLKRTGLWDETLLIWGGEFGRTPTSEGLNKPGRDHNPHGFSVWMAGAGVKGGQTIGATDELGFRAVERPCPIADLHATILRLMGLEHTLLTYPYQGLDQRLTGVKGRVVSEVLS